MTPKKNDGYSAIDLFELWTIVRLGWKYAAAAVVIVISGAGYYAWQQDKIYQADIVVSMPVFEDLSNLYVPNVQGVHLLGHQICDPVPAAPQEWIVRKNKTMQCISAQSVFGYWTTNIKDRALKEQISLSGERILFELAIDHGTVDISAKSTSSDRALEGLKMLLSEATRLTEEYFQKTYLELIKEKLSSQAKRLEMMRFTMYQEREAKIVKLESILDLMDDKVFSKVDKAFEDQPELLGTRIVLNFDHGVSVELSTKAGLKKYIKKVRSQDYPLIQLRAIQEVQGSMSELEQYQDKTPDFKTTRIIREIRVSEQPVEPNYLFIAFPAFVIALIVGLMSAFIRFFLIATREKEF
jgi:hypothetical protein